MDKKELLKSYKDKLGEKSGLWTFPKGKETFSIGIYENGFVLSKRKNVIVLDLFDLLRLSDLTQTFNKKKEILKSL